MSIAKHCDGPECNSWEPEGRAFDPWMTITTKAPTPTAEHFCSPWCALRRLSEYAEPPTAVTDEGTGTR